MSARYDYEDDDYEDEEIERVHDDPNQCPECGDNLALPDNSPQTIAAL